MLTDRLLVYAVAVVVVLVIIIYSWSRLSDHRRRDRYRELYNLSTGDMDGPAAAALEKASSIRNRTAEDEFTIGAIIELNANYGDVRGNPATLRTVASQYNAALDTLQDEQIPAGLFIVDHIGGFIDRNQQDLLPVDFGQALIAAYQETAPQVHAETATARLQAASVGAHSRLEVADGYIERSRQVPVDPQNVHDSAVNASLRKTLARLVSTTYPTPTHAAIDDARKFITDRVADPSKRQRALSALDTLSLGAFNSTLGISDADTFALVWSRADEGANAPSRDKIQTAVVDSLADFFDKRPDGSHAESPVCVNGRCGRLLESLVLLDHDDQVGGAQTTSQHKVDIMEQVKSILHKEIETAKSSPDESLRAVGKSYDDPTIQTSPEAETKFKETVKKEIDVLLETKKEALGPILENVRSDAYAAVV